MKLALGSIHVYPIKSLGGYATAEARLTDRGLEHDRRWMLVDDAGTFQTQRDLGTMACLHTAPSGDGFRVMDTRDGSTLELPWTIRKGADQRAVVWSDAVRTLRGEEVWDLWFSERLQRSLHLVYMPDAAKRRTDGRYAKGLTSLSDGFPYLIVSQASLDDLNARLDSPIPMDRFRPNLVIGGGAAFQEDGWTMIRIGDVAFNLVKPCARCVVVTTDQRTGARGKEPLRTLASFRSHGNKVMFGMNAVGDADGMVRVGDLVTPDHA
jgi:uncharacterized protein YcbX